MKYRKLLGDRGEAFAAEVLQSLGFEILATKYRTRYGEIDIIARENACYHFIEVKTRVGNGFGYPEEAVDRTRQDRMKRTAEFYMLHNNLNGMRMAFDVIAIEIDLLLRCF